MPSIKMKNKLNRGSIGGKSGLHVCQKSNIISKNLISPFKAPLHATEFESCTQNSQDVYSSIQVSPDYSWNAVSGDTVDYQDWLDGENFQLQPQTPYFVDPTIMGRMISDWQDFPPASSPNLGTIFSPALKSDELHGELNVFTSAEIKNEADLPQLRSDDSDDNSGESCDYTTCSTSDFSISDMIVADLPFDGNTMHDKRINTSFFPGFKCPEQYVILPFSEDAVGASDIDEAKLSEVIVDSDESSLYLAIEQLRPESQECDINYTAFDHGECFDSHLLKQDIPDLLDAVWSTVLPKKTLRKHITLVLDLDETLVHSTLDHCDDADFSFPVFFNSKEHTVYVKQRPYLHRFLERVAEMFEIIVFTASQSIYAKQLLDTLDPDGKLISRRAYRESCIFSDGSYTKDLTVLGVDLAKVAIIDNSPQVFRLQVNNGIPIKSWFDDQSDSALISLLPFLENLAGADDVRPLIAKKFGNKD